VLSTCSLFSSCFFLKDNELTHLEAQTSPIYSLCWADLFEDIRNAQVETFLTNVINRLEVPLTFLSNPIIVYGLAMQVGAAVCDADASNTRTRLADSLLAQGLSPDEALLNPGDYRPLIGFLASVEAALEPTNGEYRNCLNTAMDYLHDPLSFVKLDKAHQDIDRFLSALLETSIDVYGRGIYGATPSIYADVDGCWDEQYEAV